MQWHFTLNFEETRPCKWMDTTPNILNQGSSDLSNTMYHFYSWRRESLDLPNAFPSNDRKSYQVRVPGTDKRSSWQLFAGPLFPLGLKPPISLSSDSALSLPKRVSQRRNHEGSATVQRDGVSGAHPGLRRDKLGRLEGRRIFRKVG